MSLILHHQNERSISIGCMVFTCQYYDPNSEQNCNGKTWDGGPAIEWCEEYEPETIQMKGD